MGHSSAEIFAFVLVDIAVIIVAARLFGRIAAMLRQPPVVGEIVAGLALGPSLLGALPGDLDTELFPSDVVPYLKVLAQLGLVLFMFIVGLELDVALIRGRERIAGAISFASIVVPFALGALLALFLANRHDTGKPVLALALFLGVAMSITAFPVLARILSDRRMQRTTVGALALAAAAVDDILAWTLLAFVVAVVKGGSPLEVLRIVGLTAVFAAVMFWLIRPLLTRLLDWYRRAGRLTPDVLAVILVGVLLSAYLTEHIGIHAIFGAFLFGTVVPRDHDFVREILERLEQVSVLLLLPLFFVVTGMGVNIGGLGAAGWFEMALVVGVAVVGKFAGAYSGARLLGMSNQHSGAVAVLMNTRGLTELVILSVGRELGVLDDDLFTMMVMMALITTAMAEPLLRIVYPDKAIERDIANAAKSAFGAGAASRAIVLVDGPPGPITERMRRLAHAAAEDVILSRVLPVEPALEVGASLPDLAAMAQAVEELEVYGDRVMCRFGADPGAELLRQLAASGAETVVVNEYWLRNHPVDFDGVTVLVVPETPPANPSEWVRSVSGSAVALSDSAVFVRDDGARDGIRALAVGARAGRPLTVVSDRRRIGALLEPLDGTVVPATALPQVALVASATVLDRLGGSEPDLRAVLTEVGQPDLAK